MALLPLGMLAAYTGTILPDDMLSGGSLSVITGVLLSVPVIGTHLVFWIFGGAPVVPRSCSAARQCHGAGRRRFHRHAHRRVTPRGGAGSYRPRERSPNTAVSSQDQVHPQPQTRGAQCAHADPRAPG